jgi:adenylyltransferase/sulfurtransferase
MDDRYHRQRIVPKIGESGQSRIRAGHAVIVGVGALGCVVADLLTRAGIGTVTLIDRDVVDATNLHRQTLFTEADATAGAPKAEAARIRLAHVNAEVAVRPVIADLTATSAEGLVFPREAPAPTVIVDGTDNFETRYVLNDLAVKHGVPLVYGGAVGTRGTVAALVPGMTACLRCIAPEPPAPGSVDTCDTAGVLGPVVGVVASMQAGEAIKILSGNTEAVVGALIWLDVWTGETRRVQLKGLRDPACPCCGARRFSFLESRSSSGASVLCGRHTVQVMPSAPVTGVPVDLGAIGARLRGVARTTTTGQFVRASLDGERSESPDRPVVLTVFGDGRALISGIASPERARSIYARYVGL